MRRWFGIRLLRLAQRQVGPVFVFILWLDGMSCLMQAAWNSKVAVLYDAATFNAGSSPSSWLTIYDGKNKPTAHTNDSHAI